MELVQFIKRHYRKLLSAFLIILVLGIVGICAHNYQKNFFRNLQLEDIKTIQIYSYRLIDGEQITAVLAENDKYRTYEILKCIELNGFGNDDFTEYYPSRYHAFIIELQDGTKIGLSPSAPFYIINAEIGFRCTSISLCNSLADLYYELNLQYFGTNSE